MRQAVSSEWCWKTRPVPAAPCCFLSQTQAGEGIRWASPDLTNCWFTPVSSDHSASASFCINLLLICCHSQNKRGKLLFLFVCLFKWLQFQTGRNLCYLVHVLKPVSSFLCVWRNVDKFKSTAHIGSFDSVSIPSSLWEELIQTVRSKLKNTAAGPKGAVSLHVITLSVKCQPGGGKRGLRQPLAASDMACGLLSLCPSKPLLWTPWKLPQGWVKQGARREFSHRSTTGWCWCTPAPSWRNKQGKKEQSRKTQIFLSF